MEDEGIIDNAMSFLEKLRDIDEARLKFIKKDGQVRFMRATLNFDKIPLGKRPKGVNIPKIMIPEYLKSSR